MNLQSINLKKIGLVVLFLAVIVLVGFLLYSLFFKSTPAPSNPDSNGVTPGSGNGLPEANNGTPSVVSPNENGLPGDTGTNNNGSSSSPNPEEALPSSEQVSNRAAFSSVNKNGQPQFYNPSDNRFYAIDSQGKLTTLSDQQFFGVQNVIWSPDATKAILEYPDGSKVRYNFATKNQVTLPKHWEDFNFSPDGNKIVAKSMGLDADNRWLIVANEDGSKATNIESMGANADKVITSWSPNNQSIAFFSDGVDFNRKEVFFVGQHGENFKSLITEGRGFQPLWSPQGDELVYSVYSSDNDYKPTLWIVGAQGDTIGANRRPLELNTWADKCTYSQNQLYCAVPTALERGAGLYPATARNTPDLLYKIDPNTGQKQLIPASVSTSMNNLTVSPDGMYLYFTEGNNAVLRKIKIK